ncbi:MAG: TonB-dependent receptor, partial [Phenylobacterium zucineum]
MMGSVCVAATVSGSAWAQDTAASSDLAEVVVTATRRAETVSDVPLAVSAFSQQGLDQKGVRDVSDLTRITPSITFTPGWAGSTEISIRGISSSIGAATTGIYLDDTPIQVRALGASATTTNAYPLIFDLGRVEVLRGPQGTLFGAGSQGGTIRFITPEPDLRSYSAYGRGELAFTEGGDPTHELGIAVGGPIVEDRIGFRVSAFHRRDGGWVDRVDPITGAMQDKNSDHVDATVLRGALKIAVSENLTVTPAIYYQRVERNDTNQFWRNLSDPSDGRFHNGQSIRQPGLDRYTLYSLAAEYDFGPATLVSNTSFFDRNNPSVADYTHYLPELLGGDYRTGYRVGAIAPSDMHNTQESLTQEIRLQSNGEGRLKWVVGGFYQDSRQTANQAVRAPNGDALSIALYGVPLLAAFGEGLTQPGDRTYYGRDKSVDRQFAGFGQVDYSLLDNLTVTAGLRVAKTKFRFSNVQGGPFNAGVSGGSGRQSESPITPKFGIDYKPTSDLMLYASAAKGFRPGGANSPVPTVTCRGDLTDLGLTAAPTTYKSDTVWSYEAGAKGAVLDRRLRFEASAFYIDWKNIQSSIPLNNCGFGFVGNLGSAVSKGFDAHITASPVSGLTLEASVGYTDAEFRETVFGGTLAS